MHFGRKVEVNYTSQVGKVSFAFGRCAMKANRHQLRLTASAESEGELDLVVDVVTRHLERYAFRENPCLEWQSSRTPEPVPSNQGS